MSGTVGILNVGAGDIELRFDKTNPAETLRAGRIVKDMLRRGYALLVEVEREDGKRFERALDFNENSGCYIIADFDPVTAMVADEAEVQLKVVSEATDERENGKEVTESGAAGSKPARRGRRKTQEISASGTRAVAVGRSAGG